MATRIMNRNLVPISLPQPYGQFLAPGAGVVVSDEIAAVISNFGGLPNLIASGVQVDPAPSGSVVDAGFLARFGALLLAVLNSAGTFLSKFTSLATADRTVTIPDASFTIAQAGGRGGMIMLAAPVANEATAGASTLVADVALADGALTVAAQPKYPCKLNLYKTDANSSAAATATIVGKGPCGEALSEVVSLLAADGTHTYVTANAFSTITSITISATAGATGADKIAVGQSSALGLPIPSGASGVVVFKAGVAATSAAAPTPETVGTVDATARTIIPTTAPDGTKAFTFWYSFSY